MLALLSFVTAPWFKYAALGAAVLALVVGGIAYHRSIYNEGKADGKAEIINDVQQKTIETLDAAQKAKDQADQETREKPYGERVDGLR